MKREALIERKTKETDITLRLVLEGEGGAEVSTGIPFLDHMLELFAGHSLFDLEVEARGDLETGYHHTVEDTGICMGEALRNALADKAGIRRYGEACIPMDEALVSVCLDLSGRTALVYNPKIRKIKIGDFNLGLIKEFFRSFTDRSRCALHVNTRYGEDPHHIIEAVFKAWGRSLRRAVEVDPRVKGIPSTKGEL